MKKDEKVNTVVDAGAISIKKSARGKEESSEEEDPKNNKTEKEDSSEVKDVLDVESWEKELEDCGLSSSKIKKIAKIFVENELDCKDVGDFDHDLLKSMGLSVAKERIAILKCLKSKV